MGASNADEFVGQDAYGRMLAWLEENVRFGEGRLGLAIFRAFGERGTIGPRCTLTLDQCNDFLGSLGEHKRGPWRLAVFQKECSNLNRAILAPACLLQGEKRRRMLISFHTRARRSTPGALKFAPFDADQERLRALYARYRAEPAPAFLERAFRYLIHGEDRGRSRSDATVTPSVTQTAALAVFLDTFRTTFDEFIEERTNGFLQTSRAGVFQQSDRFIQRYAATGGYFVLTGPPGIGKSAWLAEFVRRNSDRALLVCHFNTGTPGVGTTMRALGNICAQLLQRVQWTGTSIPPDWYENGLLIGELLGRVSETVDEHRPMVIAVDAVDELREETHRRACNPLFLPTRLPPYVLCFLTSRKKEDAIFDAEHVEHCQLDPRSESNRSDIVEYIRDWRRRRALEHTALQDDTTLSSLAEKSEGNFMYLLHVLPEVARGAMAPDELPLGLHAYYRRHWRSITETGRRHRPDMYLRLLGLLAVAREPVTESDLARWADLERPSVRQLLREWSAFLTCSSGASQVPRWSVYHAEFRRFIEEELEPGLGTSHCRIVDSALRRVHAAIK